MSGGDTHTNTPYRGVPDITLCMLSTLYIAKLLLLCPLHGALWSAADRTLLDESERKRGSRVVSLYPLLDQVSMRANRSG